MSGKREKSSRAGSKRATEPAALVQIVGQSLTQLVGRFTVGIVGRVGRVRRVGRVKSVTLRCGNCPTTSNLSVNR